MAKHMGKVTKIKIYRTVPLDLSDCYFNSEEKHQALTGLLEKNGVLDEKRLFRGTSSYEVLWLKGLSKRVSHSSVEELIDDKEENQVHLFTLTDLKEIERRFRAGIAAKGPMDYAYDHFSEGRDPVVLVYNASALNKTDQRYVFWFNDQKNRLAALSLEVKVNYITE